MSELEQINTYFSAGFRAFTIRQVDEQEKLELPEFFRERTVYAAPLRNFEKNETRMFYFVEEETKLLVQQRVNEGRNITGYHPCFYCTALGSNILEGGFDIQNIVESIKLLKDWDVRKSNDPNTFEIHFTIEGEDKIQLNNYKQEVEDLCLILSLKNQTSITINGVSEGQIYEIQPFSLTIGMTVKMMNGVDQSDLEMLQSIYRNNYSLKAAEALRSIYGQITNRAKIIFGWAVIEELFNTKPNHILTKNELDDAVSKIKELHMEKRKEEKSITVLKDANMMAENSRNERISETIAKLLGEKYHDVYQKVRNLTSDRGKLAHNTSENPTINAHIDFIKTILHSYLELPPIE